VYYPLSEVAAYLQEWHTVVEAQPANCMEMLSDIFSHVLFQLQASEGFGLMQADGQNPPSLDHMSEGTW